MDIATAFEKYGTDGVIELSGAIAFAREARGIFEDQLSDSAIADLFNKFDEEGAGLDEVQFDGFASALAAPQDAAPAGDDDGFGFMGDDGAGDFDGGDDPFGAQDSAPAPVEDAFAGADAGEGANKLAQANAELRARAEEKDSEERAAKEKRKEEGERELDAFNDERDELLHKIAKQNKEEDAKLRAALDEEVVKPWNSVHSLVDINARAEADAETSRMRKIIIGMRHTESTTDAAATA